MRFINLSLGVIEAPNNNNVIEQYKKRPDLYKAVEERAVATTLPKTKKRKKK